MIMNGQKNKKKMHNIVKNWTVKSMERAEQKCRIIYREKKLKEEKFAPKREELTYMKERKKDL